jgi:hypothetical protein
MGRSAKRVTPIIARRYQHAHVFHILEAVSQIAKKRVVQVFQHSSFSDDISNALGTDD